MNIDYKQIAPYPYLFDNTERKNIGVVVIRGTCLLKWNYVRQMWVCKNARVAPRMTKHQPIKRLDLAVMTRVIIIKFWKIQSEPIKKKLY